MTGGEKKVGPRKGTEDQRENDIAGTDDDEAGAEEIVGPEDESRTVQPGERSAAQKVKDDALKR
ncbi:MAG: hypothetical protein H7Y08_01640 [Rhizobiaceae bacterium]|nr:hypothetical protein [Rhizobiaceae bacterium]